MDRKILQKIKIIAKNDFNSIEEDLKQKNSNIQASVEDVKFSVKHNKVEATCRFHDVDSSDVIEASINYSTDSRGVYADSNIKDISTAILSAMSTITAADEDAMGFDDPEFNDFDEEFTDEDDFVVDGDLSLDDEYEDPESDPDIETDNNIDGHYIAECDRCHGIFISALVESDQQVEYISGICPLCEKESDQYIKWVIKPVTV